MKMRHCLCSNYISATFLTNKHVCYKKYHFCGYSTIYSLRLRDSRDSQDSETPETPRLPRLRDSRGFCHITFQFSFISDLQQNSETPKTPSGALVLIMVYYIHSSSSSSRKPFFQIFNASFYIIHSLISFTLIQCPCL